MANQGGNLAAIEGASSGIPPIRVRAMTCATPDLCNPGHGGEQGLLGGPCLTRAVIRELKDIGRHKVAVADLFLDC
jgi:hypothetical protein